MTKPWRTLSARTVYENRWLRVREDRVVRPDCREGIYGVVEIRPSAGVVALNGGGEIVLVGQWRYPHDKFTWEIPRGGSLDGENDMEAAARRELREEAGVEARVWTPLGTVDLCNGVTTDTQHLFLATGLTLVPPHSDAEEQIVIRWIPFPEAVRMALSGEMTECCSVAAILKVHLLAGAGAASPA